MIKGRFLLRIYINQTTTALLVCARSELEVNTLTGVKNDSATNLALEFSYNGVSNRIIQGNQQIVAYEKLHLGYFLVDLLHELNNKVDKLVLEHRLRMEIRY